MLLKLLLLCLSIAIASVFYYFYGLPPRMLPYRSAHVQEALPLSGKILVTGAAGFIGFHMSLALLRREAAVEVIGIDNLNDYYSVALKEQRVSVLQTMPRFTFIKMDLANSSAISALFRNNTFSYVIHLAAQAGVRHSFEKPLSYVSSNLVGFVNIIEGMRHQPRGTHLLYASSSSVYGGNTKVPFSEADRVDAPLNLYAATKKADEALAYSYASLYGIPMTGMRFFTVFGPWGRPDMAAWQFTQAILRGDPIKLFNNGKMARDFTYIDDVVHAMRLLMHTTPVALSPPHRVVNIGNSAPISLGEFVQRLEAATGKRARVVHSQSAPGEVLRTFADVRLLHELTGFAPRVELCVGLQQFVDWFVRWQREPQGGEVPTPVHTIGSAAACKLPRRE